MPQYLVRARPTGDTDELHGRLKSGEFEDARPFGTELTRALLGARYDAERGEAVWEEEDYCSPPLAQERDALIDDYFDDVSVEEVNEGGGWKRIEDLPSLYDSGVDTD